MAKKAQKKQRKSNNRQKAPRGAVAVANDSRLRNHLSMVMDPCNAIIGPTSYRGKDGFITRFNGAQDFDGLPANTCAVIAYWPRMNRIFASAVATAATGFAIDFYNATLSTPGPGGPYLTTNASETRPIAACLKSNYTGTELDRQGYVAQIVAPLNALMGTLTITSLRQLAQKTSRVGPPVETKWIPGPYDEDYVKIATATPSIDVDDNVIVHVFGGFASGKLLLTHQITHLQEWQPLYGLGIQVPTPSSPDVPAGLERVRTALSTAGHWWLEATATVGSAVGAARSMVGGAKMLSSAVAGAAKVAPLLLAL